MGRNFWNTFGSNITEKDFPEHAVEPLRFWADQLLTFIRHLSGNEFVPACYSLFGEERNITHILADAGLSYAAGYGFFMKNVFTGEEACIKEIYFTVPVPGHDCLVYRCRLVNCQKA